MTENIDKIIDWEERRFEILKALIAANSNLNFRNSEALKNLIAASRNIIDSYRDSL